MKNSCAFFVVIAGMTLLAADSMGFESIMNPQYIVIDLADGVSATHYQLECLDEIPGGTWSDEYKTTKLVLRHVPAGSFIMGGRETDYPGAVNTNLHMVTLTKDFYIGVFEVTQRQWELVMGNRPSAFSNETCYATRPVENVSYIDVRGESKGATWPESKDVEDDSFIGRIRAKSGLRDFDLPTEAQWEYACRAGTATALNTGLNLQAITFCEEMDFAGRYAYNSGWKAKSGVQLTDDEIAVVIAATDGTGSARVGSYEPNAINLYDMHGNVWEWVLDYAGNYFVDDYDPKGAIHGSHRVRKGGSLGNHAYYCCSGSRDIKALPSLKECFTGFRLCLHNGKMPDVIEDAVPKAVTNAIRVAGFVDADVIKTIDGGAEEYTAFKAWVGSVKGSVGSTSADAIAGEAAVVANTNAAAAYLLGAERLFENAPKVEFGEVEVAGDEGGDALSGGLGTSRPTMTVSVTVKDGEEAVKCAAEKVKEMFEATSDLSDWNGAAKLTPVVSVEDGEGATMRFKVTPGDGTATQAFLRIRK